MQSPKLKIQKTVHPTGEPMSYTDWCKAYSFGSRVQKYHIRDLDNYNYISEKANLQLYVKTIERQYDKQIGKVVHGREIKGFLLSCKETLRQLWSKLTAKRRELLEII